MMGLQLHLLDLESYSLRIVSCYSLPRNHYYADLDLFGTLSCYIGSSLEVHDYLLEDLLDSNWVGGKNVVA